MPTIRDRIFASHFFVSPIFGRCSLISPHPSTVVDRNPHKNNKQLCVKERKQRTTAATMAEDHDTKKDARIQELEARIVELEQAARLWSSSSSQTTTGQPKVTSRTTTRTTENETAEKGPSPTRTEPPPDETTRPDHFQSQLSSWQIERYSSPLLLPSSTTFGGVAGQVALSQSSVLVVGAGGIGSTVLLYLAGAGVGQLGICDHDCVEVANLHRQVLHSTLTVGWNKARSAQYRIQQLNPHVSCTLYTKEPVHHGTVESMIQPYDCIVDCSDNRFTRYLLNDACVLAHKPLVSGSALGTEGQLTVYWNQNHNQNNDNINNNDKAPLNAVDQALRSSTGQRSNPCYRCLYPCPSTTTTTTPAGSVPPVTGRSCSDAGVLGPVPGLIGILQAVEVLKLLTRNTTSMDKDKASNSSTIAGNMDRRMLLYDAMATSFMSIQKPRQAQPHCLVCGHSPTIRSMADSLDNLTRHLKEAGPYQKLQQQQKTAAVSSSNPPFPQVTAVEYNRLYETKRHLFKQQQKVGSPNVMDMDPQSSPLHKKQKVDPPSDRTQNQQDDNDDKTVNQDAHILLDVRNAEQYALCALPGSVNIPLSQLSKRWTELVALATTNSSSSPNGGSPKPIYCMCRRGFASVAATKLLLAKKQEQQEQNGSSNDSDQQLETKTLLNSEIINVQGGLDAWRRTVDPTFPKY